MESLEMTPSFWNNKRVLITGHTGFKGSWLTYILDSIGAEVKGYSLEPNTNPSLFKSLIFFLFIINADKSVVLSCSSLNILSKFLFLKLNLCH